LPERERTLLEQQAKTLRQRAIWCIGCSSSDPAAVFADLKRGYAGDAEENLWRVRAIQLVIGGIGDPRRRGTIWEGYSKRGNVKRDDVFEVVRGLESSLIFHANSNPQAVQGALETGRTLAMLEFEPEKGSSLSAAYINMYVLTPTSPVVIDVHHLIVLARLKLPHDATLTQRVAETLLNLDQKIAKEKRTRDSNWPLRIAELHAELATKDPKLNDALLAHKDFGRPDHALFSRCPGFDRKKAAAIFLARAEKDKDFPWNADLVGLMGELPAEQSLPVLRRLWGQAGLEETILPVLAKHPEAADREKFLHGLSSPQQATVRLSLEALETLPVIDVEAKHVLALVLALRRLGETKEEKQLQERLAKYLQKLTGQDKLGVDKQAWADWFAKAHPELAARLAGPDGVDVKAWERRLAKIDWDKGDAERGGKVYIKANCASCHSGAQALGPDLHGVANRFSRADLLTAIIQPSKDIAPRYRTTQVETTGGKIYQGLIIYEAVDSLILQTGPAATIRLDGAQIVGKRFTDISLMPAGLLDMLKDQEIVDLLAYLKSLGQTVKK
jgi:putative heme-binding domain-containing protein